jgi:hypothetical protein
MMRDGVVVVVALGFLLLTLGLVRLCDKLSAGSR